MNSCRFSLDRPTPLQSSRAYARLLGESCRQYGLLWRTGSGNSRPGNRPGQISRYEGRSSHRGLRCSYWCMRRPRPRSRKARRGWIWGTDAMGGGDRSLSGRAIRGRWFCRLGARSEGCAVPGSLRRNRALDYAELARKGPDFECRHPRQCQCPQHWDLAACQQGQVRSPPCFKYRHRRWSGGYSRFDHQRRCPFGSVPIESGTTRIQWTTQSKTRS